MKELNKKNDGKEVKKNMKKNKKGFTLIELLAVIVILAVLILLALPQVLKIMRNAKEKSYLDSANALLKGTKTYIADASINNTEDFTGNILDKLEITGIAGKIVRTYYFNSPINTTLDVSELSKGIYFAAFYCEGQKITRKFIKQ